MGKIKKIKENELVGGTKNTDVYPVTSTKAVYDENNERLDNIINKLDNIINKIEPGIIYDVSANNDGAVFESLQALLSSSSLSTLIPTSVRHGGMSIRFIQGSVSSSDNKYVQYRLMVDDWSVDTDDWAIADEGVYVENPEFVYIKTDAEGKILWAIKTDGSIYYGAGCPQQIKDYIEEKILSLSLDEYENIVAFLNDYLGSDTTLKIMIDSINAHIANKLDAEGLDSEALGTVRAVENQEYIAVETDNEDKILSGRNTDGSKFENLPVEFKDKVSIGGNIIENISDQEGRTEIKTDSESKILSYRDSNGVLHENVGIESPTIDTMNANIEEATNPSDILNLNPKAVILPILSAYKNHNNMDETYGRIVPNIPNFSLLWFSDIHSDREQMGRIMKFYNEYKEYFDDIICTGDVVQQTWDDDFSFWSKEGGDSVLFVNGNHDCYKFVDGTLKTYHSAKDGYERFIEPFLSSTNIQYVEDKMYWFKDYPESGIRLIAVDDMHINEANDPHTVDSARETGVYPDGGHVDNGEQIAWFESKLSEAKSLGYQVICSCHRPPTKNINSPGFINCTFNGIYPYGVEGAEGDGLQTEFKRKVQDFIESGGEFVCWLCGHMHMDQMYYDTDFQDQLIIVVDCDHRNLAINPIDNKETTYESIPKNDGTHARDSFNVFSVDPMMHFIRMYRVGAQYDVHGRRIGSLVFDYKNKKLIFN